MRRTLLLSLLIGATAFVGAFLASALTDESIVVSGRTVNCTPEFDELPAEIEERCAAQGDDRRRQAVLAAVGAGVFASLTAVVVLRRR